MSLNSLDPEQFEQNVWNFFSKRLKWAGAPVARLYSVEVPLLAAVSWSAGFQGRREVAVWITDQYEECWMHDNLKIGQFQMEQGQTVDCLCGFPSMIFPPDAKDISPVVGVLTLLTDGTGRGKVLLFEAEIRWDNNNRDFEQLCAGQDVLVELGGRGGSLGGMVFTADGRNLVLGHNNKSGLGGVTVIQFDVAASNGENVMRVTHRFEEGIIPKPILCVSATGCSSSDSSTKGTLCFLGTKGGVVHTWMFKNTGDPLSHLSQGVTDNSGTATSYSKKRSSQLDQDVFEAPSSPVSLGLNTLVCKRRLKSNMCYINSLASSLAAAPGFGSLCFQKSETSSFVVLNSASKDNWLNPLHFAQLFILLIGILSASAFKLDKDKRKEGMMKITLLLSQRASQIDAQFTFGTQQDPHELLMKLMDHDAFSEIVMQEAVITYGNYFLTCSGCGETIEVGSEQEQAQQKQEEQDTEEGEGLKQNTEAKKEREKDVDAALVLYPETRSDSTPIPFCSLEDSMRTCLSPKQIEWNDCPTCGDKEYRCTEQKRAVHFSNTVIFSFQRFRPRKRTDGSYVVDKIPGAIVLPRQIIHENQAYELSSTVQHEGGYQSGHYYAFCSESSLWYKVDDASNEPTLVGMSVGGTGWGTLDEFTLDSEHGRVIRPFHDGAFVGGVNQPSDVNNFFYSHPSMAFYTIISDPGVEQDECEDVMMRDDGIRDPEDEDMKDVSLGLSLQMQQDNSNMDKLISPLEKLLFNGNFEALLKHAKEQQKYCLVNIQKQDEFASDALNSNTWQVCTRCGALGLTCLLAHFLLPSDCFILSCRTRVCNRLWMFLLYFGSSSMTLLQGRSTCLCTVRGSALSFNTHTACACEHESFSKLICESHRFSSASSG
jgi:hypothetical protein